MTTEHVHMQHVCTILFMPPTLKKLMGHIAFGACVRAWMGHIFSSPEPKAHGELIVYRSIGPPCSCASMRP